MARRRATAAPPVAEGLRADLAAKYRDLGARYRGLSAGQPAGAAVFVSPFDRLADKLEAGEPVELYAALLPRWLPGRRPRHGRVRLERDGTITRI